MRSRIKSAVSLLVVLSALMAGGLAVPSQAAPEVFEGTFAAPGPIGDAFGAGLADWDEVLCPEAGPADGTFYKFIDLKADFKNVKLEGPPRLFTEPTGVLGLGDYDLDLYLFDAKCQALEHSNGLESAESWSGKKGARYVLAHYYVGVHANLPFKVQAANERIK